MENNKNTNWEKSVAAIVINENKVLLTRHTYGDGKGKLIIPGGYINHNETPEDALKREVFEETGVVVEPLEIVGVRFNLKDWYIVFTAKYVSGIAKSDCYENDEVVWIDINEAVKRSDVPDLTIKLLSGVINNKYGGLEKVEYEGSMKNGPYSLYGMEK